MGLRRRIPQSIWRRLYQALWPSMGLERTYLYYKRRMVRLPGTAYSIAAGFAAGAAVSFTPLIGFHFLLGAIVAFLIRGNLIASAIGTLVGNPWTFPFIWVAIYEVGNSVMPGPTKSLPLREINWEFLMAHFSDVLLPMLLGGLILSIVVWPCVYFPVYRLVARLKAAQTARRLKKLQARTVATAEQSA